MVIELNQVDFQKVLELYSKEEIVFPLILAVLEQKQRGWVLVDNPVAPVSALVLTKAGFMQMIVQEDDKDFGIKAIRFLETLRSYIPTYLLWYFPSPHMQQILDGYISQPVRRRERCRFVLREQLVEDLGQCPEGFNVKILDNDLLGKTKHLDLNISSRFWDSSEDFMQNGIGTCVMKDSEIVSLCYAACVAGSFAEIDVITQEDYRGRGLAVVAAQLFISECLRRGLTPTWDCFVNNTASMKLAKRLGFTQTVIYPFYSFNLPMERGIS